MSEYEVMLYGKHGGHIGTFVVDAEHERSAIKRVVRRHGQVGTLQTLAYRGEFERWERWWAFGTKKAISAQARLIGPDGAR
jgi:hypothetical protein